MSATNEEVKEGYRAWVERDLARSRARGVEFAGDLAAHLEAESVPPEFIQLRVARVYELIEWDERWRRSKVELFPEAYTSHEVVAVAVSMEELDAALGEKS